MPLFRFFICLSASVFGAALLGAASCSAVLVLLVRDYVVYDTGKLV